MCSIDSSNNALNRHCLKILFKSPVTDDIVQFLADTTLRVVPGARGIADKEGIINYAGALKSPLNGVQTKSKNRLTSLLNFISSLVRHTNVYTPTLLTIVVYLNRLRVILPEDVTGIPSTAHRIFLACIILSAKFHNDSSPLNQHWAKYTDGLFTRQDVNLMERQLLELLDWNIRVTEKDLYENLSCLLTPIKQHLKRSLKLEISNLPLSSPYSFSHPHYSKLPLSSTTLHSLRSPKTLYNNTQGTSPLYSSTKLLGNESSHDSQRDMFTLSSSSTLLDIRNGGRTTATQALYYPHLASPTYD